MKTTISFDMSHGERYVQCRIELDIPHIIPIGNRLTAGEFSLLVTLSEYDIFDDEQYIDLEPLVLFDGEDLDKYAASYRENGWDVDQII